ncbi:hypothetical protein NQZ68_035816 [Dissostichus eleginoides]|nr:hypothetical protein NQZ68_035816 [Dissostichus eleginoides]
MRNFKRDKQKVGGLCKDCALQIIMRTSRRGSRGSELQTFGNELQLQVFNDLLLKTSEDDLMMDRQTLFNTGGLSDTVLDRDPESFWA